MDISSINLYSHAIMKILLSRYIPSFLTAVLCLGSMLNVPALVARENPPINAAESTLLDKVRGGAPASYTETEAIALEMLSAQLESTMKLIRVASTSKQIDWQIHGDSSQWIELGLKVALQGPEVVSHSKDPFGDGPFKYSSLSGETFELSSQLSYRDEPVQLKFGH